MRPLTLILLSAAFVGCGGESSPGAARAPARAGDVWEIDPSQNDRAHAAGAALAYVHGMHVMVVDGRRAWAGMTPLAGEPGPEGATTFHLAGGVTASLQPAGDQLELRFGTGETVLLRKRTEEAR